MENCFPILKTDIQYFGVEERDTNCRLNGGLLLQVTKLQDLGRDDVHRQTGNNCKWHNKIIRGLKGADLCDKFYCKNDLNKL